MFVLLDVAKSVLGCLNGKLRMLIENIIRVSRRHLEVVSR